jgi:hypothetical protein
VTTGSELGLYVQRRVETYPGSRQTPDFGTFAFDDRGEMVIPLATRPLESSSDVRPNRRQERARRVLSDACDRWLEQGRSERRLLDIDSVIEILAEIDSATLSMQMIEFLDQSAVCNLGDGSDHVATVLEFVRTTAALEAPSARFTRLLQHPSRCIRLGAVRLARELEPQVAGRVLSEHVVMEKDPDILRVVIPYLREAGVIPPHESAEEILSGRPDWMTAAWALTGTHGTPAALLLGDGSDFARELAGLLAAAGFRLVDEPNRLLFFHEQLAPALLSVFQLIVVVRGENYFRGDHDRNYDALAQYVRRGGVLFATPWVAWETFLRPFATILPFRQVKNSHNEGVPLRARPASTPLARELFPEPFTFETSYEELSPHADATVLLHGDGELPLYGFRRVEQGECHYLNVCHHHCTRSIASPLQTPAFARAMERVWRWLHGRCTARTSPASAAGT